MIFDGIIGKMKTSKFFGDFFRPETRGQFVRYLITGFASFIAEYLLFLFLYDKLRIQYIYSNTIVYTVIFVINFLLNRLWSFKSKSDFKRQFALYFALFLFNLAATNGVMYLLSGVLALSPRISKILVMGMIVVWNFIIYKKVIYK